MSFSRDQQKAIEHFKGPAMVLAGPGSGKTTVITHRILRLIHDCGVNPSNILVITFTRAAATEMEERFERLASQSDKPLPPSESVTFGTFHSIFFSILKLNYHLTSRNIVTERDKLLLMRELIEKEQLDLEEDSDFYQQLLSEISCVKSGEGDSADFESKLLERESFARVFEGYHSRLRARRLVDFDDMMTLCLKLLRERPAELQVWQEKYRYILVDEFQDINSIQYRVVRMLAAPRNNLFIVGDDDQSIYGFRGAHPELMLGFERDFPGTKRILLGNNYRSRREIVDYSAAVIAHNKRRFPKEITAVRGVGGLVARHDATDLAEELRCIGEELEAAFARGVEAERIAVLYRAASAARPLAEELARRQLPFSMKDRQQSVYEHFIAKDMAAYIRLSLGTGTRGDFLRIMNRPLRYISREAVSSRTVNFAALLKLYAGRPELRRRAELLLADLNTLRRLPTAAALVYIRKKVGYEAFLHEFALQNRIEMQAFHAIMEELEAAALVHPDKREWLAWTERYQEEQRQQSGREDGIRLMTYHASKGLEFDIVHLTACVEGITPYKKAVTAAAVEEERRAFYVACTRAKEQLHIYVTKSRYHKACKPSRFVPEGEEHGKQGTFWSRIFGRGADDRHAHTGQ